MEYGSSGGGGVEVAEVGTQIFDSVILNVTTTTTTVSITTNFPASPTTSKGKTIDFNYLTCIIFSIDHVFDRYHSHFI